MRAELYLKGSEAAIVHRCKGMLDRPDVIQLGDGTLWRFYRFCKPKGPADFGALYKRASVLPLLMITSERVGTDRARGVHGTDKGNTGSGGTPKPVSLRRPKI